MCGIIGIIAKDQAGTIVAPKILEGLKRLEYRGYDSAGIATVVNGDIYRCRAEGKLINLDQRLADDALPGAIGIGHTRWATHGVPNEVNAHPHATDRVALVHNGIIENFQSLKEELLDKGANFASDTDTEVVAHVITQYLRDGLDPVAAVEKTLSRLEGAFALAIVFAGESDLIIGARRGSPLVVGYGEDGAYLGSDALALAGWTNRITYLEEGDWVVLRGGQAEIHDASGAVVEREIKISSGSLAEISKGNHRHFMLKEIYEQPSVVGDTIHSYLNPAEGSIHLPDLAIDFAGIPKLTISACGTAYYACMLGKYWIEQLSGLPVEVDIASELRYRDPPMLSGGAALFVTQSGETMDTLEALKLFKAGGQKIISIVNVPDSSIARESDAVLPTFAGPEIGVASTKAFTTQLATLACLAIRIGRDRGQLSVETRSELAAAIAGVPAAMAEILHHDEAIREMARDIAVAQDMLYLGRGTAYPIALEGALKMKEISYIHAEGYAAGEMKHGPVALITEDVPVVVVAPSDHLLEKTASNVQEVAARGGKVVLLTDQRGMDACGDKAWRSVCLPEVHPYVAPILYSLPVQLLAYHVAVEKGTDVDQPRNLAKSVTVE